VFYFDGHVRAYQAARVAKTALSCPPWFRDRRMDRAMVQQWTIHQNFSARATIVSPDSGPPLRLSPRPRRVPSRQGAPPVPVALRPPTALESRDTRAQHNQDGKHLSEIGGERRAEDFAARGRITLPLRNFLTNWLE
jgi:hypothetical protein